MVFRRTCSVANNVATILLIASTYRYLLLVSANRIRKSSSVCGSSESNCSSLASKTHLDECGLWLAPSSLHGAGLGMYAGRDFAKKETLQQTGDVVIPIVDIMMHQRGRGMFEFLWDEYTWNGKSLGLGHEVHHECSAASPGFGAAVNCFLDLVNVDEGDPKNTVPSGLHRSKDPGVGAFSTYHDRQATAKVKIKAGQELFANYGQHWFELRPELGPIPLRHGLMESTDFYRRFQELRGRHQQVNGEVFEELWDEFVQHSVWKESRILGAFSSTLSERALLEKNMTLKKIRVMESMQTKHWLREHGTCADHIREGVSTIKQAGRGAFATRDLPKGTVVSALPLIPIINKSVLEMYDLEDINTKRLGDRRRVGYQLLMNYCYGHQNSTMLLCPYSPLANMVNHNQTRENVKLGWGDPVRGEHEPNILKKTINSFADASTSKLAMELVAIQDIEKDEEIFLDYGDAWERAWQEHVEGWNMVGAEEYVSAFMLNQEESTTFVRTEFEQLHNPYPGNIKVECDSSIWKRINQTLFNTAHVVRITRPNSHAFWPCDVLRRRDVNGTTLYTVSLDHPPKEKEKNDIRRGENSISKSIKLSDIPRMAIRFSDRPYTTDMFLEEAFRHYIVIPDSMFPSAWMNSSPG